MFSWSFAVICSWQAAMWSLCMTAYLDPSPFCRKGLADVTIDMCRRARVCVHTHLLCFSVFGFSCVCLCVYAHMLICVWLTGVCVLDIFMGIINYHQSPQVTVLFEGFMGKWQIGRQLDKAVWDQTKALSLGNPECFLSKKPFTMR